jgi:transcriptional regulator with XRE-family HTH domain
LGDDCIDMFLIVTYKPVHGSGIMPPRLRFSEQIRRRVLTCGLSRYRIAKTLGCSQSLLTLFMGGRRGLSIPMLDRLAALLQLEVTMRGPTPASIAKAQQAARRK